MTPLQKCYSLPTIIKHDHVKTLPARVVSVAIRKKIPVSESFFYQLQANSQEDYWLTAPVTAHKLTLLHLSVIAGRTDAVEGLLKLGANPNAQDNSGWTPLHHAALAHHYGLVNILLVYGADPGLKTSCDAAYDQILTLTKEPCIHPDEATSLKHRGKRLSQREFYKLTGARYLLESFFDPEKYLECWKERPEVFRLPFQGKVIEQYRSFKKPDLSIEQVATDSQGASLGQSPGFGVYANKEISKYQLVGEYLGKGYHISLKESDYNLMDRIDGTEFRNEIAMVNDGFPNVAMVPVSAVNGQACRNLLITLETVQPGQELVELRLSKS